MDSYQPLPESSNAAFEQKTKLNYRIKEIEKGFGKGCFLVYQIFIWILIFCSVLSLIYSILHSIALLAQHSSSALHEDLIFLGLPIYFIWLICQQRILYKAIRDLDLATANKALKLILALMVFATALVIASFYFKNADKETLLYYVPYPAGVMLISIFGACKVKGRLEERKRLIENLKQCGVNSA